VTNAELVSYLMAWEAAPAPTAHSITQLPKTSLNKVAHSVAASFPTVHPALEANIPLLVMPVPVQPTLTRRLINVSALPVHLVIIVRMKPVPKSVRLALQAQRLFVPLVLMAMCSMVVHARLIILCGIILEVVVYYSWHAVCAAWEPSPIRRRKWVVVRPALVLCLRSLLLIASQEER